MKKNTLVNFVGMMIAVGIFVSGCAVQEVASEKVVEAQVIPATEEMLQSDEAMIDQEVSVDENRQEVNETVQNEVNEENTDGIAEEETSGNLDIAVLDESSMEEPEVVAEIAQVVLVGGLDENEMMGLVFMREEEKLARDVYLTMFDLWGLNIFNNIAKSEQTHTDAVKALLDGFGIADPMTNDLIGVFENQDLQALYNQLVAQGSQSLADAILVGGAIEEIDIIDLQKNMAETENAEILTVYTRLLKGSENHLQAFSSTYVQQTGLQYEPQYMTNLAYEAIVSGSGSTGNGAGRRNGK